LYYKVGSYQEQRLDVKWPGKAHRAEDRGRQNREHGAATKQWGESKEQNYKDANADWLLIRRRHCKDRSRLSENLAATSGRQPVPLVITNSIKRAVYAGPTIRPLPGLGTMSSRITRRRDCRASSTTLVLRKSTDSGSGGILDTLTPKNLARFSRSAKSHDSPSRTATRKHTYGDGLGNHASRSGGAHSASWSRSTRTNQGDNRAAWL
jgi:hypothetical protein